MRSERGWPDPHMDSAPDAAGLQKHAISEFGPNQRIVRHVEQAFLNFTEAPDVWVGTDITFEITPSGVQTEVRFMHRGLVPEFECFDACSSAWAFFVNGSLKRLITTASGQPNPEEISG